MYIRNVCREELKLQVYVLQHGVMQWLYYCFFPVSSTSTLVIAHISILLCLSCIGFTPVHTCSEAYSRMLQNSKCTIVSPFPPRPSLVHVHIAAVCIYASYIITPDGASTSRTLSKTPHDSVYLLNTEYNISLVYTCT